MIPIEHAARLTNAASYKRVENKFGKGVHLVVDAEDTPVAIRFDATLFTPAQANDWLAEHDYQVEIEPASEVGETGVMVALRFSTEVADALSVEHELHLTLAYLGVIDEQPTAATALSDTVGNFAATEQPFEAILNGAGYFEAGESGLYPVYVNFDAPELPAFRQRLVDALQANGFDVKADHGFSPHVTIDYVVDPGKLPVVDPITVIVGDVTMYWGGIVVSFDLKGEIMPYDVRQTGNEWCLYREGNPKTLGCHPTKEEAERQMRAVLAATHSKFMVDLKTMRGICPSCADLLAGLGVEKVNFEYILKVAGVGGDFPGGMPRQLAEGLCKKIGSDPGFFTTCMATPLSLPDGWDKEGFCAELHKYCIGIWPGEKELQPGESYGQKERLVRKAWYDSFESPSQPGHVEEVFPDKVLVEGNDGKLYFYPYVEADGAVVFDEPYQVEVEYYPVSGMQVAMALARALSAKNKFAVWQKKNGSRWYAAIVSSTYRDDEDETVTGRGMDYSIEMAAKYGYKSKLYLHHLVPDSRVGECVHEMRIGPFWLEIGRFDESPLAERVFQELQKDRENKWRVSIGFLTPVEQKRAGKYTILLKFDSSITDRPANPWTAILVGGKSMNDLDKVMALLNPADDVEKETLGKMLQEVFTSTKEVTAVDKSLSEVVAWLEDARETLTEEEQSLLDEALAVLGGQTAPEATPEAGAVTPDELLKRIEALEALGKQVEAMSEKIEALGKQNKTLVSVLQQLPAQASIAKPTSAAPALESADVQKELDRLGAAQTPLHPLAGMAGAPGGSK